MSNILYRVLLAPSEEHKLIIDSNERLDDYIEEHKKIAAEHSSVVAREAYADSGEFLSLDGEELEFSEDGIAEEAEEPLVDYVAEAQAEAERILADASSQADQILSSATEQAEALKHHAKAEGHREGYDQGYQEALVEKHQMENEIHEERGRLQSDYEQRFNSMEHDLVDVICEVVDKVFLAQFSDSKELVLHLLDNALSGIEGSKEFLIRVNETNLEYLRSNKALLQDKVGADVTLDIVLDPLLDDSQCLIETDGGLFDCSMDTQMKNLIKDIKSLS